MKDQFPRESNLGSGKSKTEITQSSKAWGLHNVPAADKLQLNYIIANY